MKSVFPFSLLVCALASHSISPAMADNPFGHGPDAVIDFCRTQDAAEKIAQYNSEYTFDHDLSKNMRMIAELRNGGECTSARGIHHAGHEIVARRKSDFLYAEIVVAKYDDDKFVVLDEKHVEGIDKLVSVCATEDSAEIIAKEYSKSNDPKLSASEVIALSMKQCKTIDPPGRDTNEKYIKRSTQATLCGIWNVGEMIFKGKIIYLVVGSGDYHKRTCN